MEPVIRVDQVSKKYSRNSSDHLAYGLWDLMREMAGRRRMELRKDEFYAVNDLSFDMQSSDTLALIGRNGSGKTTMLKMLAGLIKPDAGRITIVGRVQALINLGAGFSARLSGRENIYNSAALMGLNRRETVGLLDEIVDFSELETFIDSPVGTYSSGMKARLGFAVAVHLRPDILLIDEVLAVGDHAFQNKCFTRMEELKQQGVTIVFVSHSHASVIKLCQRAVWLHEGRAREFGPSLETVQRYLDFLEKQERERLRPILKAPTQAPSAPAQPMPPRVPERTDQAAQQDLEFQVGILEPDVPGSEIVLTTAQKKFVLSGWYKASSEKTLELLINDAPTTLDPVERPDIRAKYPATPVVIGFEGTIHRDNLEGTNTVTLMVDGQPHWSRSVIVENHQAYEPEEGHGSIYGPIYPTTRDVDQIECRVFVDGEEADVIPIHSTVTIQFRFRLKKEVHGLASTLNFHRKDGLRVAAIATMTDGRLEHIHHGRVTCEVSIPDFDFVPGPYVIVMPIAEGRAYLFRDIVKEFYVEGGGRLFWGIKDIRHTYTISVD